MDKAFMHNPINHTPMNLEHEPDTAAPSILIVDDSPLNTKLLKFILDEAGYQTQVAANGLAGIEAVDTLQPDLLLLDVMMPDIDGFEVCKRVKEKPENENLPIIFITALDQTEDIVKGFELGGVDYVTKPFNKKVLLVRIKNHIDLLKNRRKVERQAADLAASNRLKSRMFSIIGHDLRSPLGSLKLSLDFINRGLIDPKQEDFKDTVFKLMKSTDEALNLLENLLGWAKSQSDALVVSPEVIEVGEAVESVVRLLKLNLDNKNIGVEINVPEQLKAMADLHMLKAVIRNLISNAIKFTPSGGSITLSAEDKGEVALLSVTDTGVGIPPEQLDKLFNPNIRTTTEGTEQEGGSGLGLLLCQDFVQKNQGEMSVDSTVGEGTTFAFTVPKA